VLLGLGVELGCSLDGHVVALGSSRGEDDGFGVGSDEVGDVLYRRIVEVSDRKRGRKIKRTKRTSLALSTAASASHP